MKEPRFDSWRGQVVILDQALALSNTAVALIPRKTVDALKLKLANIPFNAGGITYGFIMQLNKFDNLLLMNQ